MNLDALYRRLGGGSSARSTYQAQLRLADDHLRRLQQPGGSRHRATALDGAARAMAFCGDLAADAFPGLARRSGEGHRYGSWWYQESRACRILASAEWARLTLDQDPDQVHPIHPRDPLEGHRDVEPAFLRLCHEPALVRRALTIRRRLAPALQRHLPEADSVLAIVEDAYLQAVTNASIAARGPARPTRSADPDRGRRERPMTDTPERDSARPAYGANSSAVAGGSR